MLRSWIRYAILLACVGYCMSCSAPTVIDPQDPSVPVDPPEAVSLEVSTDELLFSDTGGCLTFDIVSNGAWQIECSGEWCSVDRAQGAGNQTVAVEVRNNEAYEDRNARLVLSNGVVVQTVVISQSRQGAVVVGRSMYDVSSAGGVVTVEVKHNIDFEVEIPQQYAGWIKAGVSKGLVTSHRQFVIAANRESEYRHGYIVIRSARAKDTVAVYQVQPDALVLQGRLQTMPAEGGIFEVDVKANVEYDVMVKGSWVRPVVSKSLRVDRFTFGVQRYGGYEHRRAEVIFKDRHSDLADTLAVWQAQKDAIILAQTAFTVDHSGQVVTTVLRTNVEAYDVLIPPGVDWIRVFKPTKALSNETLSLSVAAHGGVSGDRSAAVVVRDRQSGLQATLTVNQLKKPVLEWSDPEILLAPSAAQIQAALTTNVEAYDVLIPPGVDWITWVPDDTRLPQHALQFRVEMNDTYDARSASIRVRERRAGGVSADLTVVQQPMPAILLPEKLKHVSVAGGLMCVDVQANLVCLPTIAADARWITRSESRGLSGSSFHFMVDPLPENQSARHTEITFAGAHQRIADTLVVVQAEAVAWVDEHRELEAALGDDKHRIRSLVLLGHPGDADFRTLRSMDQLNHLDLSATTLTAIPRAALVGCANLADIIPPTALRTIGVGAFQNCSLLAKIQLPKHIRTIEANTFAGCANLVEIELPERLEAIGAGAFQNCGLLASVDLPASVESLGASAFAGCKNLIGVTCRARVPARLGQGVFPTMPSWLVQRRQLTVLSAEALADYRANAAWSKVFNQGRNMQVSSEQPKKNIE